jgi:hypothetical protein
MKKLIIYLLFFLVLSCKTYNSFKNLYVEKINIEDYNSEDCFPCDPIFEIGLGIEIKNDLDSLFRLNKSDEEIKDYLKEELYGNYIKILSLNNEKYLLLCNRNIDSILTYNSYLISNEGIFSIGNE